MDDEEDPNFALALEIVNKIAPGMLTGLQGDEMMIVDGLVSELCKLMAPRWGDPARVLDIVLKRVAEKFDEREKTGGPETWIIGEPWEHSMLRESPRRTALRQQQSSNTSSTSSLSDGISGGEDGEPPLT